MEKRQPRLCADPGAFDPQYTANAQVAHVKGTVVLSFRLSAKGCAENIRVVRGLGYGLDESAMYALERYRWQKRKEPVSYVEIEFNFNPLYHSTEAPRFPKCSSQLDGRQ
ncbi:MAG TPA: energy transducer TonB [Terriglobales bacterium]|nr:energy transducer TonB [Terriglobales bacterium]